MHPERFESWLTVGTHGLYCRPGGFHIDPHSAVNRAVITHAHSDHARAGHDHVLATRETLALMKTRLGTAAKLGTQSAWLRRDLAGRRRDGEARACRPRARQRAGGDRVARPPRRDLRRLQAERRPDQSSLRACPVRSVRHRGDLRASGVQPWRCEGRSGKAAQIAEAVSRAGACGRRLRARQVPAPHRSPARGRLCGADLFARRARRLLRGL